MAIPALKFESEEPVEDRIGKLEAHVEHIRADVADTRIEIRRLNDKVDGLGEKLTAKIDDVNQTLSAKIDGVNQTLSAKIDGVNQTLSAKIDGATQTSSAKTDAVDQRLSAKIDEGKDALASLALRMEKLFAELKIGRALDRVWWLLMCGTLLGVMARGFKWI
jgi:uncharacterized phage infection (PIP) family protein YhgE